MIDIYTVILISIASSIVVSLVVSRATYAFVMKRIEFEVDEIDGDIASNRVDISKLMSTVAATDYKASEDRRKLSAARDDIDRVTNVVFGKNIIGLDHHWTSNSTIFVVGRLPNGKEFIRVGSIHVDNARELKEIWGAIKSRWVIDSKREYIDSTTFDYNFLKEGN